MNSASRWKEISALYAQAAELSEMERSAFLAAACKGDETLRTEVESLLACHGDAQDILTTSAPELIRQFFAPKVTPLLGRQLGPYFIEAPLGAGGFGEVYRATDTRLGRSVAIKILPAHLRQDPLLRKWFEREARAVAALRHPHVCVLYDIGSAEGVDFLVMELLEGQSLRAALASRPLPLREALGYGIEIAEALVAIHRHGIVHRDLKPGNVMLTDTGAKLLDFGLAKVQTAGVTDTANAPASLAAAVSTRTVPAGTPAYMTPEQLDGLDVDHRSDIFAFGALLYEMIGGRKAFEGEDRDAVARAIRESTPPPLPPELVAAAPGVTGVIERCLHKSPAARWPDAEAVVGALRHIVDTLDGSRRSARLPWTFALMAATVVALVSLATWSLRSRDRAELQPMALQNVRQLTTSDEMEMDPAFSPAGDTIAYSAGRGTSFHVRLRSLASGRVTTIAGSPASQFQPRWSPDGSRLLYIGLDGVYVGPASGGESRLVVAASAQRGTYATAQPMGQVITGATWSPDGREIAVAFGGALYAVTADGSTFRHLVTGPSELHWCDWSSDAEWIACTAGNPHLVFAGQYLANIAPTSIMVVSARGGPLVEIVPRTSLNQSPVWSSDSRHLYFVSNRDGIADIYGVDIQADGKAAAAPVRITTGLGAYSIALSGRHALAYTSTAPRSNIWSMPLPTGSLPVDMAGATQMTTGNQLIESLHVTTDGKWLLYSSNASGNGDIFRIPVDGGEPEQLTIDPSAEDSASVSPDGRWLVFHSWRTKTRDIFVQPLEGGQAQQVTFTSGQESFPRWLPDGSIVFFDQEIEDGKTRGLFRTVRDERGGWSPPQRIGPLGTSAAAVTPDGRLIYAHRPVIEMNAVGWPQPRVLYRPPEGQKLPVGGLDVDEQNPRYYYQKTHDDDGRAFLWRYPIDGGPPTLLVRFNDLAKASRRWEFTVSHGRYFFTIDDIRSNIWIAQTSQR